MTIKDNGKKIAEIWLSGDGNSLNSCVRSHNEQQLELSATYHGDRDEFWVLVKKDGAEVERFNAKYVSNITWA